MNRSALPLLLLVLLFTACSQQARQEPAPNALPKATDGEAAVMDLAQAPLISRGLLFGNPDRASARLSPDGTHISWLAPVDGVLNVWVAPVDDLAAARPVTHDSKRGIRRYFWAYTNDHIVYMQDKGGNENWHAFSVNLKTRQETDLTPLKGVRAQIIQVSPEHPKFIIVGLNNRNPALFDLYKVNIVNGERELVLTNSEGFAGFTVDDDFRVRLGMKMMPSGAVHYLRRNDQGTWEPYIEVPPADTLSTGVAGYNSTGDILYLLDSRGRNTAALVARDVESGQTEVLFADPRADVGGTTADPQTHEVQAATSNYLKKDWKVLDDAVAADFEYLLGLNEGELHIVSRTLDDQTWMVAYSFADAPTSYYLYHRDPRQAEFLFTTRPKLENAPLQPMHPLVIQSRDGLDLVSYLTLPPVSDPNGDARPSDPVPLVLLVHGGPWSRDTWGYDAFHQWLANRGYAVLSVNFRGSTGLGKDFINAGNLEWAGKMHSDLIDAVNWAIENGITTQDQVAIMGGSYGGYATLVGLTFTPDVFACGVDIVGPSNLNTLLASIPPYWKPMFELFAKRVGDPRTEQGSALLKARSPLSHVGAINDPLLIGQGANDPRVNQAESDQIVSAMQAREIPVTYVLFPDEGHGFARPANKLAFYAVTEAFLGECLGGRVEPVGDDFQGSSIEVPAGAKYVPGLPAALAPR